MYFLIYYIAICILSLSEFADAIPDLIVRQAFYDVHHLHKNPPKKRFNLNVASWRKHLRTHPDGKKWSSFIAYGFPLGIKISQDEIETLYRQPTHWANSDPEMYEILRVVIKEIKASYLVPSLFPPLYNISLFCVPKKDDDGIWSLLRMVRHGSFSTATTTCINDFILPEFHQMRELPNLMNYVDFLIDKYYFALRDLKDAFRQLLLRLKDQPFCGYTIFGLHFVDTRQPYGLSSAAANCQDFGLLLLWILRKHLPECLQDVGLLHIDDFLFAAATQRQCRHVEELFDKLCAELGVVQSTSKTVKTTQVATCYGFRWDLAKRTVGIPPDRLCKLRTTIHLLITYRLATARLLESVCGKIMHWSQLHKAAKSLCYGLLHWIIEHIRNHKLAPTAVLVLPIRIVQDLKLWLYFSEFISEIPFAFLRKPPSFDCYAATDASSFAGGISFDEMWCSYRFQGQQKQWHITLKEGHAALMFLYNWRDYLTGKRVCLMVDNMVLKAAMARKWSPARVLMMLIYEICLVIMQYHIDVWVEWIPTDCNALADALSREKYDDYRREMTFLNATPDPYPFYCDYLQSFRMDPDDMLLQTSEKAEFEKLLEYLRLPLTRRGKPWWYKFEDI